MYACIYGKGDRYHHIERSIEAPWLGNLEYQGSVVEGLSSGAASQISCLLPLSKVFLAQREAAKLRHSRQRVTFRFS